MIALLSLFGIACGSVSTASQSVSSVEGAWSGTVTLTGVSGGERFGPAYAGAVGFPSGVNALPISQTGEHVTTTLTPLFPTGTECAYSGTATSAGFVLAAGNCGTYFARRCEGFSGIAGDSRVRDVSFVSGTFSGSVTGNIMTATAVETWNVLTAGTQTSVGVLAVTSRWNLNR